MNKKFYVDDCLKSVSSVEMAIHLARQLHELLALRGFRLAKFVLNSQEVLKSLPEAERAKSLVEINLDNEDLPRERTLGILWDVGEDNFTYESSLAETPLTKRSVLKLP